MTKKRFKRLEIPISEIAKVFCVGEAEGTRVDHSAYQLMGDKLVLVLESENFPEMEPNQPIPLIENPKT